MAKLQSYLFSLYFMALAVIIVLWLAMFFYFFGNLDFMGMAFWIIITSGVVFTIMYFPKKIRVSRKP